MAFELDVVVDVDLGLLPTPDRIARGRQGRECRGVEQQEGVAAAARQLLERAQVQIGHERSDRRVELDQAEEAAVAQPRQNPPLDQEHRALDLGFVSRVRRACGQQGAAVMAGELLVRAVGQRVVGVGMFDQRARLVGHDQPRHAAEEFQRLHLRADPVGGGLARCGTGVRVARRPQRGHEDLRGADLTGGRIGDRHGLPGVVDKQLLARLMHLAHGALEALRPRAVLDAKTRVLVGLRVTAGVLLPQQHQGHAGAFELLVNDREIGGELIAGARHRRAVQPPLQLDVGQRLGHRPVHPGRPGQRHVLAHRALGQLERAGHFAIGQPNLQVQA